MLAIRWFFRFAEVSSTMNLTFLEALMLYVGLYIHSKRISS